MTSTSAGSGCRVLVVDDDQTIRALLVDTLTDDGFEATEAANGAEALTRLSSERYSVILLDLDMPVMDGRTFYGEMVGRGEHPATIIISAHGARRTATELGAAAGIDKPFDIDAVSATVASHCRGAAPEGQHRCRERSSR